MKQHKKIVWVLFIAVLALALTFAPVARAGKFHFNSIDFMLGSSFVMQGSLVGLGNEVAEVTLTGFGTVAALCENNGGNQAPGRNPIAVTMQETGVFVTEDNGRALVEAVAPDPTSPEFAPSPTPKEAGCPNGNWNVVGIVEGSTNWTGATVVVRDESGQVRLELSFTCTTTFEDGVATSVQCVES